MEIDKSKFKDARGGLITQNLFIDFAYDVDKAVYTWADQDKEYKGVTYPSLRRLYLEMEDVGEYDFATTYLWSWDHWQRLLNNKVTRKEIDEWREELEVKVRSRALKRITHGFGNTFAADKWVANGTFTRGPGRPSKEQQEGERKKRERVAEEAQADASRIAHLVLKK